MVFVIGTPEGIRTPDRWIRNGGVNSSNRLYNTKINERRKDTVAIPVAYSPGQKRR